MTWLLCDYGEVLSGPQPGGVVEAMAAIAGMAVTEFRDAYWEHRPAYDRGDIDAAAYWSATIGRHPGARLGELVDADAAGWLHPNPASVEGARRAAGRGMRLAILSNAPLEVARAIDGQGWLAPFAPRIFSCDLRAVKPEPAAYTAALALLGARPDEVVFVDDRPVNVEAARAVGIRAEVFTGAEQFDGLR